MVLSNKKLKQKLRDSLAESLTASEEALKDRTKSQPQHSLTSLLGSATRKPRLSKREKRRKHPSLVEKPIETTPSLQGLEVVKRVVEIGDSDKENGKKTKKRKIDKAGLESGGSEDSVENVLAKETKKKKLKREEAGLESGGLGLVENGVTKKSKKKKKKKKKGKKKAANGEVKDCEKSANGASELGGMESIMASDRYASSFSFLFNKVGHILRSDLCCFYAYAFVS